MDPHSGTQMAVAYNILYVYAIFHKQKNTHAQTKLQPQTKLTHEQRSQNQVWLNTLHRSCISLLLACVHRFSLETTVHYADSHWSAFWRYHLLRMRGSTHHHFDRSPEPRSLPVFGSLFLFSFLLLFVDTVLRIKLVSLQCYAICWTGLRCRLHA